jgi:hypothetical protein
VIVRRSCISTANDAQFLRAHYVNVGPQVREHEMITDALAGETILRFCSMGAILLHGRQSAPPFARRNQTASTAP